MDEKMEIEVTLSKKQKEDLEQLLIDCEKEEKKKLDFFMEQEWNDISDCPCFFLLYSEKQLVCAASIFIIGREAELSAITRLEKRKKGYFSKILQIIFSTLTEYNIQMISIRIEEENQIGQQILEHWNWKKGNTDCLMELLPKEIKKLQQLEERTKKTEKSQPYNRTYYKKRKMQKVRCLQASEIAERKKELIYIYTSAFSCSQEETEWIFENNLSEGRELWTYWIENRPIGLCFVSKTKQTYFLSSISIQKNKQHQGYGTSFLRTLLLQLWEQETNNVFLQVSRENDAAIQLYKKLGFFFKQQLHTYFLRF